MSAAASRAAHVVSRRGSGVVGWAEQKFVALFGHPEGAGGVARGMDVQDDARDCAVLTVWVQYGIDEKSIRM